MYYWSLLKQECPACEKPIVYLSHTPVDEQGIHGEPEHFLVFPRHSPRLPAPSEVPPAIATDYNEAGLVLEISAQASAALSRRCLQHLLNDTGLSKNSNLNRAIEEAMGKNLPREGANKRGNSSRLTQSFHFFMFEPIFSPVNALNQPI
ncbi:MAG: DUF4145 domain-containing protein [Aeromonas sp.]|nr:DUF4145 domain-containing protein [Aeromonas sp.]MBP8268576.1 DUF4145 domain-containing protein [Aeromonas sp.]MBP9660911.1 DUF4145 domain-containing protein [Aeromonas sp.]MBP9679381.1 DUF4145 domain-containing protein [Aeromonas sp.]